MSARRRRGNDPAGLLLLDKPLGLSSFQAARRAARRLGVHRVGHAGTLDPAATGLLPLFLGPATRLVEYLSSGHKEYVATMRLGVETDTLDAEGKVVAEAPVDPNLDHATVQARCQQFVGRIEQVVPAYSAVKVGGRRLYEMARNGQSPDELPRRVVDIERIDLLSFDPPSMQIQVVCGKGTYIRVLAADIGRALGTRASLTGLVRTVVGPLSIEEAVSLEAIESSESPRAFVRSPLLALAGLPRLDLPPDLYRMVSQGRILDAALGRGLWRDMVEGQPIVTLADDGRQMAVVEVIQGRLRPKKVVSLPSWPEPVTS